MTAPPAPPASAPPARLAPPRPDLPTGLPTDATATGPAVAPDRAAAVRAALDQVASYSAALAADDQSATGSVDDPWSRSVDPWGEEPAGTAAELGRDHVVVADRARHLQAAITAAEQTAASWTRWADDLTQLAQARPGAPHLPRPEEDWDTGAVLPGHLRLDRLDRATDHLHETASVADAAAAAYTRRGRALTAVLAQAENELLALPPLPAPELAQAAAALPAPTSVAVEVQPQHAENGDRTR